ncbi:ferredoxin [Mycolicibacterium moriokaense]
MVDDHRCQGIAMCETVASDLFEVGDDGQWYSAAARGEESLPCAP